MDCDATFYETDSLRRHYKNHHERVHPGLGKLLKKRLKGKKKFKCHFCAKSYAAIQIMKNHIKSVHISEDSNTVKWANNVFGVFEDVQFETLAKEDEKIVDDVSEESEEVGDEPEAMGCIFFGLHLY